MIRGVLFVVPKLHVAVGTTHSHVQSFYRSREVFEPNDFFSQDVAGLVWFEGVDFRCSFQGTGEETRRIADVGADVENVATFKKFRPAPDQFPEGIFVQPLIQKIRSNESSAEPTNLKQLGPASQVVCACEYLDGTSTMHAARRRTSCLAAQRH